MIRKLISDSVIYAIGPQLPRVVGIFLLPVLTKYLTASDYAIYGIATAYVAGLGSLRDLGFTQVMVNYFYRYPHHEKRWKIIWKQLFGLLLTWGVPYCLLLGTVLYFSLRHEVGSQIGLLLFLTVLPSLFFDMISMFGSRMFQMKAKPMPVAVNAMIAGSLSIIVNYIMVVHFGFRYMSFFIASFAASLFSAIFYTWPVIVKERIVPIFKWKYTRVKSHFKVGLPTIPHSYSAYLLNTSDRIILDIYKQPLNQVGMYNFAYSFGIYADIIGGAIGMAAGPVYTQLYAKRELKAELLVRDFTFFLQIFFLLGSMLLSLWCREIFSFLSTNKELASAYPFAIIIVMSYSYRPMYWVAVSRLGFEEKTHHLWKISLIGGIINVVLNVIFIPYFGINAAIIATFIGLMYIGFSGFYLKAFKLLNNNNYYPMAWLASIILCTIGIYFLKDIGSFIKILVTFTLILITVGILFKFKKQLYSLKNITN